MMMNPSYEEADHSAIIPPPECDSEEGGGGEGGGGSMNRRATNDGHCPAPNKPLHASARSAVAVAGTRRSATAAGLRVPVDPGDDDDDDDDDDGHEIIDSNDGERVLRATSSSSTAEEGEDGNNSNEEADFGSDDDDDLSSLRLRRFWRTYDQIIILSIFSVLGIIARMMSATWFRLELGSVFSEDSALGTNLPLNMCSCFLMGLLCSGRGAMGIVHSKVMGGGSNPYGSGRGILEASKGAFRGAMDAGRAGMNRARGYTTRESDIIDHGESDIRGGVADSYPPSSSEGPGEDDSSSPLGCQSSPPPLTATGLHRRRRRGGGDNGRRETSPTSPPRNTVTDRQQRQKRTTDPSRSLSPPPRAGGGDDRSIAGLLGLNDEFLEVAGSSCQNNSDDEMREVQLRGLTRRIMASPSLALFPARKKDMDVMEHYESRDPLPSSPPRSSSVSGDRLFEIGDLDDGGDGGGHGDLESGDVEMSEREISSSGEASGEASGQDEGSSRTPSRSSEPSLEMRSSSSPSRASTNGSVPARGPPPRSHSSMEEQVDEMIHAIGENVTALRRMRYRDGWDVDTSPEKMKHIILLGLRVGFCGALSTFSSLNASVIRLLKSGSVGEALVGYGISIQLGIVSYRFGQHLAVYIFVWRCRRESRRDERRGYGLRLVGSGDDADEEEQSSGKDHEETSVARRRPSCAIPSVRAFATFAFVAMFVSLCLAIYFFPKRQQYICSLLFTPFGCLARWKLMNAHNKKVPGFPIGTFFCNLLSCALSGSLGSFLAGNPGPEESIVLTSMIAGFAGSLSTFATFIVEILGLIDPILFKFDGLVYAVITILWAVIIGLASSQAKNWADEI